MSRQYSSVFSGKIFDGIEVFNDEKNQDAIIECSLVAAPDFEDQKALIEVIEQGVQKFITVVNALITGLLKNKSSKPFIDKSSMA
jgi:wyosine [tRNA(Phe)-imidazoG37] synthetase (radical SAM superfamily)